MVELLPGVCGRACPDRAPGKKRSCRCNAMAVHAYSTTFHGLVKWSKKLFSTLGWMLIAKREERAYKLAAYLEDLKHLELALRQKKRATKDGDRKADLEIMISNAQTLNEAATELFKESASFFSGTVSDEAVTTSREANAANAAIASASNANANAKGVANANANANANAKGVADAKAVANANFNAGPLLESVAPKVGGRPRRSAVGGRPAARVHG